MKRLSLLVLALTALAFVAARATAAEDKANQSPLEGRWVAESIVHNGEAVADVKVRLAFSGSKAISRAQVGDGDKQTEKYTVKLDTTVTPNQIDFIEKEGDEKEVRQGICKVEGDKLTLCVQTDDDRPRPTEFESKEDDGRILVVFKRAKKKPKERKEREE